MWFKAKHDIFVNLNNMNYIYAESDFSEPNGFAVWAQNSELSNIKDRVILKDGFKNKKDAKTYINELLKDIIYLQKRRNNANKM